MFAVAILEFRHMLGEKKIWLLALFLMLPALLTAVLMNFGGFAQTDALLASGVYLFLAYPQAICLILALLYSTAIMSTEVAEKTLTYLFTRPIAKWKIVISKYLTIVACLGVSTLASLLVSWCILGLPGGLRTLAAMSLATGVAIVVYCAIFAMLGIIFPKWAMVIGLIYAVVIEVFMSFVPAVINTLTATYYLRSVVMRMIADIELPPQIARMVGEASLTVSLSVLAVMTLTSLGVAALVASQREYAIIVEA